jgi:hypothetical protein
VQLDLPAAFSGFFPNTCMIGTHGRRRQRTVSTKQEVKMPDQHRHETPPPASLNRSPASIGDALVIVDGHAAECSEARRLECLRRDQESADRQGVVWGRIVSVEKTVSTLSSNVKFAAWVLSIVIAISGIAGPFIARYAMRGVIAEELHRMLPEGTKLNAVLPTEAKTASAWSPFGEAHASGVAGR